MALGVAHREQPAALLLHRQEHRLVRGRGRGRVKV